MWRGGFYSEVRVSRIFIELARRLPLRCLAEVCLAETGVVEYIRVIESPQMFVVDPNAILIAQLRCKVCKRHVMRYHLHPDSW